MKKVMAACCAALLIAAAAPPGHAFDLQKILTDFASLDFLYQPEPFRTRMVSTADPQGSNRDWDNFLQKDDQRAVLADIPGPGIITRIFCARPKGILKIYLDDNPEPVISAPVSEFFSGKTPPFSAPLVGNDPAAFSYFPIPFASRARIEIEAGAGDANKDRFGWFWQAEWLELPADYQVKSLALPLSGPENTALEKLKTFLVDLEKFEPPAGLQYKSSENHSSQGKETDIISLKGPAVIRKIKLVFLPGKKTSLDDFMEQDLVCYWDDELSNNLGPSVNVSLKDFFGNSFNERSPKILVRRFWNGGESMIPMPFADRVDCDLWPSKFGRVRVELWYEPLSSPPSPLRFHAMEREQKLKAFPEKQNLGHKNDYLVLDASGQGRYLGTSLTVLNRYLIWWGEGDESFFIDGKLAWLGTGSEDYFDGSYNKFGNNLFSGALIENSYGKKFAGITAAYRFHLLDPVYFQDGLKFGFEHGAKANDLDNWYRSVAYWYQTEPHSDFARMAGDRFELGPKTVKAEVEKEIWRAIPLKNKIVVFLLWGAAVALALLLILAVTTRIWVREFRKGG
jgi:hypothetical protein